MGTVPCNCCGADNSVTVRVLKAEKEKSIGTTAAKHDLEVSLFSFRKLEITLIQYSLTTS